MIQSIRQLWGGMRLDRKVSAIAIIILALLILHSLNSIFAIQGMLRNVENRAFVAADIQYLTLEAERNFRKAAVLQRDFFYEYPQIGLEQAQKRYALPAVQLMNDAIGVSESIDARIANSTLSAFNQDISETYSDGANTYQNIFIKAAAFIAILTDPNTGLEPQLDRTAVDLGLLIKDDPALIFILDEIRILERAYFVVRTPNTMGYVTDKVTVLREALQADTALPIADRNKALSQLDIYVAISEEIVAVDLELDRLQIEFDENQASLDLISTDLNRYATRSFEGAQLEIQDLFERMVWINLFLVGFGISFTFLIIYVLRRTVTYKVVALTHAIRRFQSGYFSVKAEISSADEIGRLGQGFNEMAEKIANLLQHLEERNEAVVTANQTLNLELNERKKIQQSLELQKITLESFARDLQRSNRELEEFAYIVSHDLRAPLRGISTLITWLSDDYISQFDEMGAEMLDLLVARVKRLDDLIQGILEFSRVGRDQTEDELVDLQTLLEQTLDTLSPPPHIDIVVVDELPAVYGERIRLGQLFQNIIDNAIKYIDKPEGEIIVGCRSLGQFWEFTIEDNGPGIDPKYHEKIFQIFQTLETDEAAQSTGVGLSMVKKIVTLFGGKIALESQLGEGTRFIFTLPKTEQTLSRDAALIPATHA